jgi:hypothetical protein
MIIILHTVAIAVVFLCATIPQRRAVRLGLLCIAAIAAFFLVDLCIRTEDAMFVTKEQADLFRSVRLSVEILENDGQDDLRESFEEFLQGNHSPERLAEIVGKQWETQHQLGHVR